jgi:hypothetical protein
MKKIVLSVVSGILLFSCTTTETFSDKSNANDAVKENQAEVIDSAVIEPVEEKLDLKSFTIEDYAAIGDRASLESVFSKQNLVSGSSTYGEGTMTYLHSVLTNPSNGHVVKIVWDEKDTNKMNFIETYYNLYDKNHEVKSTQNVASNSGISLGMSIKDLYAWNEHKEIKFSGFAWDFHGNVHGEETDSKLKNCSLSLAMEMNDPTGIPSEFLGDVTLSTSEEKVISAPIVIGQLTLFIN